MGYGRWLEEFTVGEVIRHWPGRTITEADCTWFALLTMNQHPIHSDAHYAATQTQHGQRVVLGPLVFSIGIGMTVADVSGKAIANLEIERITHEEIGRASVGKESTAGGRAQCYTANSGSAR